MGEVEEPSSPTVDSSLLAPLEGYWSLIALGAVLVDFGVTTGISLPNTVCAMASGPVEESTDMVSC